MLSSLLDHTAAASGLRIGCRRLGVPDSAAVELIRFLLIKSMHQTLDRPPKQMCACAVVEQLWCWMLLNTKVSAAVHDLIGGVVEHISHDEQDSNDNNKMMQQLYSMNIMSYEGWEPDIQLWEEPGTAMSGIYVKESVDGKSPALYVTPATTEQQCQELMEDVRVLYQGYSRRNSWLGPIATAASSSAAATAAVTAETPSVPDEPESWEVVVVCPAAAEGGSPEFHRVQATDSMTVRLLKRQLIQQGLPGSSPATLRVFERFKELQDHMLVPCQQGAFLRVLLPARQSPTEQPTYQLYIKTLHGFTCEVSDCGPGSFVGELKGAAGLQLGQAPAQLRLIFAGKQLQDESLLEQYNIQKECTINCVTMRGVP